MQTQAHKHTNTQAHKHTSTQAFYVGIGAGQLEVNLQDYEVLIPVSTFVPGVGILIGSEIITISGKHDETAYKIYSGYRVNERAAIETHYIKASLDISSVDTNIENFGVSGIYSFKPNKRLSPFIKLGLNRTDIALATSSSTVKDHSNDVNISIGGDYQITKTMNIRGELERLDSDTRFYSLGLQYSF